VIRVFSRGILRIPHLQELLGEPLTNRSHATAVAGWGLRPSARRAIRYARRRGLPYLALEDGFLRSIEPGPRDPPLSMVVDDVGIYYDASRPSRLEALIAGPLRHDETTRAKALINAWRAARVSKYNHLREYAGALPEPYVLVVDQTFGDASIHHGLASAHSFVRMVDAASAEHEDCTVLIKTHPEVMAGRKRGYFAPSALAKNPRVRVLAEHVHPVALLEHARAVYAVTSQMGFEGLLWNKPVRTFGMPFYAGWGLTEDDLPAPNRRRALPITLEQLAHAALLAYPRYVHPETGRRCEAEEALAYIALQRRLRQRFPAKLYAAGFSPYKRRLVRRFCQGSEVEFVRSPQAVPAQTPVLVWGKGNHADRRVVHLEDGFLRSVGLGADLVRPISWVLDERGIYYDATGPSDLEHILQTASFNAEVLARARALRERVVATNMTKYNVGGGTSWQPGCADRAVVILVPGQVESDASLAWGAPAVRRNLALLRAVRESNPTAWLVYKPHPDVVAGLRRAGDTEAEIESWCDEIVTDVAIGEVLTKVDHVHTLTSLAGFEALLRGKRVTCHGQPFYAGWGLTTDLLSVPRRTRRLTLDELTAGVLIEYPTYVSRTTGRFTTPERALDELLAWRSGQPRSLPFWRRALRWGLRSIAT
jgi:capsular polysaccharide export protein